VYDFSVFLESDWVNGLIVRQDCQATWNPMQTFLSGHGAELTGTSPPHGVP
jgi:hypothetical protein